MPAKIRRSSEPDALEFPFEELSEYTPNDLFYVRNHFPPPTIDLQNWTLSVEGTVQKTLKLRHSDILAMPSRTVSVTLECAGNSRTFLSPPVEGVQWNLGGISSARWTGVPLSHVLALAGLNPETVDVMFEGGDKGEVSNGPKPTGPIYFARSIPREKAMDSDVLLAYQMNGENLTSEHGFPLRVIVPGWYAVSSVKWLTRIVAIGHPFQGYFQSVDYAYWDRLDGQPQRKPITEMLVKSQISRPLMHEILPKSSRCVIEGAAWSGVAKIAKVEVSTDGGITWSAAQLSTDSKPGMWVLWKYDWVAPEKPGNYVLLSRATDVAGNRQAFAHDQDRETYMINFCLPISLQVE
jgi:DMSO/TMAO reductase YedYZ molybdopterin-dependent catalytic subunit